MMVSWTADGRHVGRGSASCWYLHGAGASTQVLCRIMDLRHRIVANPDRSAYAETDPG